MAQNGTPVSQLFLRVAHPQKNAIFGSLKKRNFWVPIFGGGKIVPPMDVGCFNPTNRVKWRAANKKYSREGMI